ncbi:SUZ domain-containing protein [Mycena indigotica]|uniref:SUZ domain-containing protein n=1 Tax=Mycena indigotica TaxID=2126181 RepID=A0A8H6VRK9_9AGAR|nr:SUZ domain-containing protein [Mycena indigotica]KAF7291452.1 SUZ domain-containing protein [Mycena indigotica]
MHPTPMTMKRLPSSGSGAGAGGAGWDAGLPAASSSTQRLVGSTSSAGQGRPKTTTTPAGGVRVVDDWEEDDDPEEAVVMDESREKGTSARRTTGNRVLWEADADGEPSTVPTPMPAVVSSSRGNTSTLAPAAFQPQLRILKRSPATSPAPSPSPGPSAAKAETLEERERRYAEARERIFGEPEGTKGKPKGKEGSAKKGTGNGQPQVQVSRNPKGPAESIGNGEGSDLPAKGFAARRGKGPSSGNGAAG